jgi:hypothetical protein
MRNEWKECAGKLFRKMGKFHGAGHWKRASGGGIGIFCEQENFTHRRTHSPNFAAASYQYLPIDYLMYVK